ncbi:hypothetical protein [Deinococcus marmoris]|uniref:hypothetical protein n=1 Tax=Deinococcus marmoris TaxID=249408 RepID=UPI0004967DA5|nr:hypothetical protein [Deinococcus marmoris]
MPTLNRRLTRTLLLAALTLPVWAGAATPRFAGVSWKDPADLKVSDRSGRCPSRCVVYEGKKNGFPLLRVHEAVIGSGPQTLKTLMAWMQGSEGETVRVVKDAFKAESVRDGAVTAYFFMLERGDRPDDRSPDYSTLLLLEQGGVTLPLELYGLSRRQVEGSPQGMQDLLDSVKLDPAAIRKDLTARAQAFTQAAQAITNGYARGEKVRLYTWSRSTMRNVYTPSGMQLQAFNDSGQLAFLPGGVFLEDSRANYRAPDLKADGRGELPARWKSVGGNFQVTTPGGKTTVYTVTKLSGGQTRIDVGSQAYYEIPALTARDVTGIFSTKYARTSGTGDTAVNSSGSKDLELLPNGRYEDRGQSFTSLTGPGITAGSGGSKATGGTWSYDAASYVLTLKPEGGGSRSGPTYTQVFSPANRQIKGSKSVDWLLLGADGWWKSR